MIERLQSVSGRHLKQVACDKESVRLAEQFLLLDQNVVELFAVDLQNPVVGALSE